MAIATSRPGTDPVPGEDPATKERERHLERLRLHNRRHSQKHAAVELLAFFDDGHEERFILRRASARRKIRMLEGRPGFRSASVVRRMTFDEWKDHCLASGIPATRLRRKDGPPASPGTTGPAATATAPPVRGWEIIMRQDGKVRTIKVAAASEDVALSLVMAIAGVDAATILRPLSPAKFRDLTN